jgi:hypothetical protein
MVTAFAQIRKDLICADFICFITTLHHSFPDLFLEHTGIRGLEGEYYNQNPRRFTIVLLCEIKTDINIEKMFCVVESMDSAIKSH